MLGLKTQNSMISWDHVCMCYWSRLEADICALLPARAFTYFVKCMCSLKMHKPFSAQKTEFRFSFSLVCALNTSQEHFIFCFWCSDFAIRAEVRLYAGVASNEQFLVLLCQRTITEPFIVVLQHYCGSWRNATFSLLNLDGKTELCYSGACANF